MVSEGQSQQWHSKGTMAWTAESSHRDQQVGSSKWTLGMAKSVETSERAHPSDTALPTRTHLLILHKQFKCRSLGEPFSFQATQAPNPDQFPPHLEALKLWFVAPPSESGKERCYGSECLSFILSVEGKGHRLQKSLFKVQTFWSEVPWKFRFIFLLSEAPGALNTAISLIFIIWDH